MFWTFAVSVFKFACKFESTFIIFLVTFDIKLASEIPVPLKRQVFLPKTSVTTNSCGNIWLLRSVKVNKSPILRIWLSFVTNL